MNGCEDHFVGYNICQIVQTCFKSDILGNHRPWVEFLTDNLLNEHPVAFHMFMFMLLH